ncbi:MAG: ornithine carbamoyltransferase [Firmicutes bacterium]|nr:ornithine carbamoyltransferase [Bacillota bacterium]
MKHFLKISDLSSEEVLSLINLGIKLKEGQKKGKSQTQMLNGKVLGMIFSKSSTRTRVSFEVGMTQLGGTSIFLNQNDIQLNRGESIADTARVLSRYLDIIMIRTFKQSDVEELAKNATIPVINGLTDYCHPTQALADLMTVKENFNDFKNVKICYCGDGNNVANSLIVASLKCGCKISLACPKGYYPNAEVLEWAKQNGGVEIFNDPKEAVKGAQVVYTDVWASMGQEAESEARKKIFMDYQVNESLMALADKNAIVLHCLPAHKEEEISHETFEKHQKVIFDQSENRMHMHKAIMVELLDA